jgi:uncharacterized protein (DUF1330 family)
MADLKVYMVVNLEIKDKEIYRKYEKGFFSFLKKYDGEFITYDDSFESLEGSSPLSGGRVIIFSFPSEEKAKQWWNDAEYQELSEFRKQATDTVSLSMIKGLPPRE